MKLTTVSQNSEVRYPGLIIHKPFPNNTIFMAIFYIYTILIIPAIFINNKSEHKY
jgi:hypothetical protein